MPKKLLFCFSTIALVTAFAASSYHVTLFDQSIVAGKTLQPGNYKLELKDDGVVLQRNKEVTEVPAHVETAATKFNATSVKYNNKHELEEISLGGTNKKVIIGTAPHAASHSGL